MAGYILTCSIGVIDSQTLESGDSFIDCAKIDSFPQSQFCPLYQKPLFLANRQFAVVRGLQSSEKIFPLPFMFSVIGNISLYC